MSLTVHPRRSRQTGLSLVELMVGITIGLIIVAAASLMMTNQVKENSQLLMEVQLQQDLRAAAELMLRDIRRAGFNSSASTGVWAPGAAAGSWTNIYAPTSPPNQRDHFYYAYGKTNVGAVPASNESFGFAREVDPSTNRGVIVTYNGSVFSEANVPQFFQFATTSPNKQPLTDPNTVNITGVDIQLTNQPIAVGALSSTYSACTIGDPTTPCPCLLVRLVTIKIDGTSVRYPDVKRTITVKSKIRNDQLVPSCTAPP